MTILRLREWERRDVASGPPTTTDLQLAERLRNGSKPVGLSWSHDGLLRIETGAHIGTVQLSAARIEIVPKLVGEELGVLQMLAYARRAASLKHVEASLELDRGEHLLDVIVSALLGQVRGLLRRGLVVGYRTRDERMPVLRGRLRVLDQVRRHGEAVQQLECRYGELSTDVPENQLLTRALQLARLIATDLQDRTDASRLLERCRDAASPWMAGASHFRRSVRHDRRTRRYEAAHELALMLIEHVGIQDPWSVGAAPVGTFLIDMNALFEAFVERLVIDAHAGDLTQVHPQLRRTSVVTWADGRPYSALRPDLVLRAGRDELPIDAKYKLYDERVLSSSDIAQAFLYAHAFPRVAGRTPDVVIVYPSDGAGPVRHLQVKAAGGTTHLRLVGLDVTAALGQLQGGAPSIALKELVRGWVADPQTSSGSDEPCHKAVT